MYFAIVHCTVTVTDRDLRIRQPPPEHFTPVSESIPPRTHAAGLGVPDLKIWIFPQYKPGEAYSPEEAEKAVKAAAEFPQLLLGKSG